MNKIEREKSMARVILAPFIEGISGKVGNLEFRTYKNGKTTVRVRKSKYEREEDGRRKPFTAGEKAAQRRFGIVAHVTGVLQNEYKRIDEAAQARQKIWNRVSRHYEKMLELCPEASDRELTELLLQSLRAGQKEDKKSTKPLFSRTL
jgi:hypothetical protein